MPVHHLVFFKFRGNALSDALAAEIHADIPSTLLNIPGVTEASFGKSLAEKRAQGFTHMLSVKFESRAAFGGWAAHPMHHKWGGHIDRHLAGPADQCIRKLDIDYHGPGRVAAHHVVFFQMADSFTEEMAAAAIADLESTICLIPGVLDVAFEKAFITGVGQIPFTHALTVKFDSRMHLEAYQPHPLHAKWGGAHLNGHIKQVQCLDVEVPEHARVARL